MNTLMRTSFGSLSRREGGIVVINEEWVGRFGARRLIACSFVLYATILGVHLPCWATVNHPWISSASSLGATAI